MRKLAIFKLFSFAVGLALLAGTVACGDESTVPTPQGKTPEVTQPTPDGITSGDADVQIEPDAPIPPDTVVGPDTPISPDQGPDTPIEPPDGGPETTPQPDIKDATLPCPGGEGCDCSDNSKCDNGLCIETPDGKKCAKKCIDKCEPGYSCESYGSIDPVQICLPNYLSLCSPCSINADCQVTNNKSLCIDYGPVGKFCGGLCSDNSPCPDGYECKDIFDAGSGQTLKQCKLKDKVTGGSDADCSQDEKVCVKGETCVGGKCKIVQPAVCECSVWAKAKGFETACSISNEFGTCSAKRKCAADGLGPCGAKTPKAEVCNGEDDNCDGNKDNLAPDFKCSVKGFKDAGSKAPCTEDKDCTQEGEKCDTTDGKCKVLLGECFGKPNCLTSGALECVGAKTPKIELCNGEDDDCDGGTDEDYSWQNPVDGASIVVGKTCGVGPCQGGAVKCKDFSSATCDSFDKNSKPEECDNIDNNCDGQTDNLACDDKSACTEDICDGANKKCENTPIVDCDDKNLCTADKCNAGTGKCEHSDYQGSCDDGNKCTVGDTCGKDKDAKWACLPGAEILDATKCDDKNPCTLDGCNVQSGCEHTPQEAQVPCYTAKDPKTEGVGVCKGGFKKCKEGKLLDTCEGEMLPAATEACDGKDDTCNGATDEGCKPTSVTVTFSSAYVSGKSGQMTVQMLVGPSGPVGKSVGQKYTIDFGFLAWLMSLFK